MYWLKNNNSPCVCVGLNAASLRGAGDALLRVVTICCSTYHNEVSVGSNALEPLTERNLKSCTDERSVGFAMAMVDFAEWELSRRPTDAPLCKWYMYPEFIRNFLCHAPSWKVWRTQAERAARGTREERRKIYFDALVEEFEKLPPDSRLMDNSYPWDDTPVEEPTPSPNYSEKNVSDDDVGNTDKDESDSRDMEITSEDAEVAPAKRPTRKRSIFNIFMLPRSTLPCLFYDSPEKESEEKFIVLPVCCHTYHYPVEVQSSALEPLSAVILKRCTDERTLDFALALMAFASWHLGITTQIQIGAPINDVIDESEEIVALSIMTDPSKQVTYKDCQVYKWPSFILNMICQPREWASWRKRVERSTCATRGNPRKLLYFKALSEDFLKSLQEKDGGGGRIRNDGMAIVEL